MKHLLLLIVLCLVLPQAQAQKNRGYSAEHVGLELEGKFLGWLKSGTGGMPTADVLTERTGELQLTRKHLGKVRYEPITIETSLDGISPLTDWLRSATQGKPYRSGALIFADFNFKATSRLEFQNALLTEFAFPDMDAASKEAGVFRVTFVPEVTRQVEAKSAVPTAAPKAKAWVPSNFRLTIPGLDCTKVSKISGPTFRLRNPNAALQKEPQSYEVTDVSITLAESNADSFLGWLQDFVVNGKSGDSQEKEGKLEALTPTLTEVLGVITLRRMGIFQATVNKPTGGIPSVTFKLYIEELDLQIGK